MSPAIQPWVLKPCLFLSVNKQANLHLMNACALVLSDSCLVDFLIIEARPPTDSGAGCPQFGLMAWPGFDLCLDLAWTLTSDSGLFPELSPDILPWPSSCSASPFVLPERLYSVLLEAQQPCCFVLSEEYPSYIANRVEEPRQTPISRQQTAEISF